MADITLRAIVQAFDDGTYRATVQLAGSIPTWLAGVRVSRAIPSEEMVTGRGCAVLFFDLSNPDESVVVAVWG